MRRSAQAIETGEMRWPVLWLITLDTSLLGQRWEMLLEMQSRVTWLIGLATTVDSMHFDKTVGRAVDTFAGLLFPTMAFLTVWTDWRALLH
jgi:hypothetical protein